VESKWKNYHIITFPAESLSKTDVLEEAVDLSYDRLLMNEYHTVLKYRLDLEKNIVCKYGIFFGT
jgi:hypothetical protein